MRVALCVRCVCVCRVRARGVGKAGWMREEEKNEHRYEHSATSLRRGLAGFRFRSLASRCLWLTVRCLDFSNHILRCAGPVFWPEERLSLYVLCQLAFCVRCCLGLNQRVPWLQQQQHDGKKDQTLTRHGAAAALWLCEPTFQFCSWWGLRLLWIQI